MQGLKVHVCILWRLVLPVSMQVVLMYHYALLHFAIEDMCLCCRNIVTGCYPPCLRGKSIWVHVKIEQLSVYVLLFLPRKRWSVNNQCWFQLKSVSLYWILFWFSRNHMIIISNINSHPHLQRLENYCALIATVTIKYSWSLSADLVMALSVVFELLSESNNTEVRNPP